MERVGKRKRYLLGDGDLGRKLQTRGTGGTNANQSPEEVAATVTHWNEEGRLFNNYTESKDSTLIRFDLTDGGRVAITKPINPYTPETLMVTAFEPPSPRTELTAQYIYTKSSQMQYKYWQTTLAQMIALERQVPLERTTRIASFDKVRHAVRRFHQTDSERYVFFMENTGPLSLIDDRYRRDDLQGYSPRTARTGAEIHLHVAAIEENWLKYGAERMPELEQERQTLRKMQEDGTGEKFVRCLSVEMAKKIADPTMRKRFLDHVTFVLEEGSPVGYSLQFNDISMTNALKNISYFSQIMQAHFLAYPHAQEEIFGDMAHDPQLTSQPSFRTYGQFEKAKREKNRTLLITIAPQVNSYQGALEAAGVELQRSPNFSPLGTDKQADMYRKRLMRATRRLTKNDRVYETRRMRKFSKPELP